MMWIVRDRKLMFKYDYEADLEAGRYDNGIAVRTGLLHHGPFIGLQHRHVLALMSGM
jgi:hypothetical protein